MTRWKDAAEKYEEPLELQPEEHSWYTQLQLREAFQAGCEHAYQVGRAEALEEAIKIAEEEARVYVENPAIDMYEMARRSGIRYGAGWVAIKIRALITPTKEDAK